MIESLDSIQKLRPSKSMTLLLPSCIDTEEMNQIGNYTLGIELGSGAFGKVVLGKHIITGEKVAIKILDKTILNQTPEDYELVKKEMSILKLVKHKYIIQLYEILQTPKYIFIIMEYCEGKDLMDYILSKNYLPESEALKYFQQLINALFYLHSQNIAHRDIKIDNLLLDHNKNLKLIDFGLSTKYQQNKLLDQPCGTIVYSAPEVLEGKLYHGMLADIWSCGIVLYGMLFGYLPFSEDDDRINKKNIIEGKFEIPENISLNAKDLLKHMLDINPMTRYTLQEIKAHPWFKMNQFCLIQGIIIGYHKIPIDEDVLDLCEKFDFDKNKIRNSVINNKFDEGSSLYYLLVKKRNKEGIYSVSDLFSDKFIKYIYDENNLIKNNTWIHMNKRKNKITITDINQRMRKTESDLSAAPGLFLGSISTPKKNKKYRMKIIQKNLKNEKNDIQNDYKHKMLKKNKKIKLYSSINKKSLSKMQKSNNLVSTLIEDKNFISNTSGICTNKKIKNKITKNQKCQNNNNNNEKSKNKIGKKTGYKDYYKPFNHTKFFIDDVQKTIKNNCYKENLSLNLPLSTQEIILNKTCEKNYPIAYNSQITKKTKNRIKSNSKIYSVSRNENKNKLGKWNCVTNLRQSKDYSIITKEKFSKSIDTIELNSKIKNRNKSNEKSNHKISEEYKHKNDLGRKTLKNITPINKIIKNNNNYLPNYLSTTNSKEKRFIKSIKKPKIKINDGYSTNYTNYTKSSSHSSNVINKNKKRISTNTFNLCKKYNINNYNKAAINLKKNINNIHKNICDLIIDNFDKNKNKANKSSNILTHFEEKNSKKQKMNLNNIKLIKINKLAKLKKSSKYLYFNNKILKGIKYRNQAQNMNQSKTIYDKYKKRINVSSVKKHKNKISISSSNDKGNISKIKKGLKNAEDINIIKVNQRSKKSGKNLTSPIKYKKKQKIKDNSDIKYNKNNSKKRYFESTVITRRYKSPVIIRELSESQKQKYLNKKSKNQQIYFKEKTDITFKKYSKKHKKNPFTINNHKIKNKIKYKKNKTPLKIITNINLNNQNSSILNKCKLNTKNNITQITNNIQINTCYSKENIYYAPNFLYKLNSPKNKNNKSKYQEVSNLNNHNLSINFFDAKTNSIINADKNKSHKNSNQNKCHKNPNQKIYHRNINHFNISNTNNNHFSNYSISTSLSLNSLSVIKDKSKLKSNKLNIYPTVLDLSCIIYNKKNLNECCIDLINKLKKFRFDYIQKSINIFDCWKNEDYCQIEILQILSDESLNYNNNSRINIEENIDNPIFYYNITKIKGKNNFIKTFSKIIFPYIN